MLRDDFGECLELWFGKSQETDDTIWSEFQQDVAAASLGLLEHWSYATHHPQLMVALVILLDQFRRNMYRGTRGMYACDAMCASYVKRALEANIQEKLSPKEMIFFLLVLTHSEDLEDQYLCMVEYGKLEAKLEATNPLRVFREVFSRHVTVIEQFKRFPHRNEIYGRKSTAEEEAFLLNASFRFDLPVAKNEDGSFTFKRDGKLLWKTAVGKYRNSRAPKLLSIVEQAKAQYERLYGVGEDEFVGSAEAEPGANFCFEDPDAHRQAIQLQKHLRIGDKAPNFTTKSTIGIFNLYDYLGDSWGVIFSHPKDFTPVCTTELGRAAQLQEEFEMRNVKLLALSVDQVDNHEKRMQDIKLVSGVDVNYPIISDSLRKISMKYGMLDQSTLDLANGISITIRSVYIINPKKKVSLILSYPVPVGRNFDEILRAVDALQMNYDCGVALPADWAPGKPAVVLPFYSDAEAREKFGDFEKVTDYLRFIPDPGSNKNGVPENGNLRVGQRHAVSVK